jgi:hypothetical protein
MARRIALADLGTLGVVSGLVLLSAADAKSLATDRAGSDRRPVVAGFAGLVKSRVAKRGSLILVALQLTSGTTGCSGVCFCFDWEEFPPEVFCEALV